MNMSLVLKNVAISSSKWLRPLVFANARNASAVAKESLIKRLANKIQFLNIHKTRVMASGYYMYENVADNLDYMQFFEELKLSDTFYSWFVITELHIWMLSVRAMAEGDDGKMLRNHMVEALWHDVMERVKKLGAHNPAVERFQISELSEQLQAALIAYDEGLLGNDMVLAGAVWRRFYSQQDVDPYCLDILVKYIRKQILLLDRVSKDKLMENKPVKWGSLK